MLTVGIDEVGRGCLAGPLVAGAVVLEHNFSISKDGSWKLVDSKRLSHKQRLASDTGIRELALAIGLGWVDPREIDRFGLTKSVSLAMRRALRGITVDFDQIIIDGNYNFLQAHHFCRLRPCNNDSGCRAVETIVKADATVPAVSAASIVAKVARDKWMCQVAHAKFPDYGFDRHVGYGTKQHLNALQRYGATPLHRRSYAPVQAVLS